MVGHYSWEAPVKLHVPEALFAAVVSILRSVSRSDCVVPILPPSLSILSPFFLWNIPVSFALWSLNPKFYIVILDQYNTYFFIKNLFQAGEMVQCWRACTILEESPGSVARA